MRLDVTPFLRRLWNAGSQPAEAVPMAEPVEPAELTEAEEDSERRQALRQPCHREAWLYPVTLVQSAPWHAIVLDISGGGIGLAVEQPVPLGTFFAIELPDPLKPSSKRVRGQVVHASPQGHNYWHIGCVLETALNGSDVEYLLQ
jgi:hypothetical protein